MVTDQPAERLDISGRDPATLTPLEKLAYAYPDVHALVQQLAAAEAAIARVRALTDRAERRTSATAAVLSAEDVRDELAAGPARG